MSICMCCGAYCPDLFLHEVSDLRDQVATLTAQRDRLAELLRMHAAVKCPSCDGMGIDMTEDEDHLCRECAGTGSAYPADVTAALAELEKSK